MTDLFECRFGEMVDLDKLYEECDPANLETVRLDCIKELGYARMYMDYIHPELNWSYQRSRVEALCEELAKLHKKEHDKFFELYGNDDEMEAIPKDFVKKWDRIWFKFHYRIGDETENMC